VAQIHRVVASVFPYFPVLASKLTTLRTDTPLVTTWHEVWDKYLGHLALFGKFTEYATAHTPQYPIAVSGVTAERLAESGPHETRSQSSRTESTSTESRTHPILRRATISTLPID